MRFPLAAAMAFITLSVPVYGASVTLTETQKFTNPTNSARSGYGGDVAISGGTVFVGAHNDHTDSSYAGAVYSIDLATGATTRITSDPVEERAYFGQSLAVSGSTLVVGAHGSKVDGVYSGAAYVVDTTTGAQIKLTPDTIENGQYFSFDAVATDGNIAVVGAWYEDVNGEDSGAAYLFDTTTGAQLSKLTPNDPAADNWFGGDVAISGNTVLVSATGDDTEAWNSGAVYLFDATTGDQTGKLIAGDGDSLDFFGSSMAVYGNYAVFGQPKDDEAAADSGSVYLFDLTTGEKIRKFTAEDTHTWHWFGTSVAISDKYIVVGAQYGDRFNTDTGSAYVFDLETGEQIAKLKASDGEAFDRFGTSVAVEGENVIVGSFVSEFSGGAYHFDLSNLTEAEEETPEENPSVVPLPAGVWLLGSALGLIALNRRRS